MHAALGRVRIDWRLARLFAGRPPDRERERDRIADRGSAVRLESGECGRYLGVVVGRGDGDRRVRREGHEADPVRPRQTRDELLGRGCRGAQAGRRDVLRDHRARGVHREGDRGLLPFDRDCALGSGEPDDEHAERGEQEHQREVAAPRGHARDHRAQHVHVREGDRVARAPTARVQIERQHDRHEHEAGEHEWPGERHDARRSRRASATSRGRSHSPCVLSTT